MDKHIDKARLYDVVVVGGGPAGLTAAIYLARARYRVLVLEKDHFGGQITITAEVVNYPGVPKTSGAALTESMRRQAESFGAEFMLAEATEIDLDGDIKTIKTTRGELYCFGVLLATGAHPREVGFAGEREHKGRGVAYCATCDGEFFTGKEVFVVGGGFAAAEEGVFLTKFARHVTILVRGEDFSCAASTAEQARRNPKITVLTNTVVEEAAGDNGLNYLRYRNRKTGELTEYRAAAGDSFGVFVFAGYAPATELVKGAAALNEQGYILTDRSQQTSVPGLYAAGDVCVKPLRQVVTAVGEGALAATELERYAAAMQEKTGISPEKLAPAAAPQPEGGSAKSPQNTENAENSLFDAATRAQLETVFAKLQGELELRLYLDDTPLSGELRGYMQALADMTGKLRVSTAAADETEREPNTPCVRIYRADGSYSGLGFHGVPGGHEFTSFVLGLYNAAGPGQAIDAETEQAIRAFAGPVDMQVLVSLSCTMCPELVAAAQKAAAISPAVTAEVYDLNHYPALRDRYKVMSVPCLVLNGETVTFGKKNLPQLVDFIRENI